MYNNLYKINKHREKLQVDKKKTPKTHNENASIKEFLILKIQEVNVFGKVVCLKCTFIISILTRALYVN